MTESHFISAGGAKTIAMAVMDKQIERGFALVRPPGHHAMRVVHGARGFCNINIEAVMVEYLRKAYGIDRVAIVDTDCHHGDGTQDIYWHDPDTLFISIHQDGRTLYPGSGFSNELGGPNAVGSTINIPLPPNTSEEGFLLCHSGTWCFPFWRNSSRNSSSTPPARTITIRRPHHQHEFFGPGVCRPDRRCSNRTSPFWRAVMPSKGPCPMSMSALFWPWPAWITATCESPISIP